MLLHIIFAIMRAEVANCAALLQGYSTQDYTLTVYLFEQPGTNAVAKAFLRSF